MHLLCCSCFLILNRLIVSALIFFLFFFNDTATTEIYTLSLHDALPILTRGERSARHHDDPPRSDRPAPGVGRRSRDRKSTRLNSSHVAISYAVFCLKKKKNTINKTII